MPYLSNTERRETEAGHFYTKPIGTDGKVVEVPGCTSVLGLIHKPQLYEWAVDQERDAALAAAADLYDKTAAQRVLNPINFRLLLKTRIPAIRAYQRGQQKAMALGSMVHWGVESYIKTLLGQQVRHHVMTPDAQEVYNQFLLWVQTVHFEPMACELPLVHPIHDYGGTLDFVAKIDGKVTLVDIKTSKSIWPEHKLQLHACKDLWEVHHSIWPLIEQMAILKLPKTKHDGPFEFIPVPYTEKGFDTFLCMLAVWEYLNHGGDRPLESAGLVRPEGVEPAAPVETGPGEAR